MVGLNEVRTFSKHLTAKDDVKLSANVDKILSAFPGISKEWLCLGTGEPPEEIRVFPPKASACNQAHKLVGDLLHIVMEYFELSTKDIQRLTKIDALTLQAVLESRIFPDFQFLDALHQELGINPSFFFHANEKFMFEPESGIDRVLFAIGEYKLIGKHRLQELFGMEKEEAKQCLNTYKEGKKNILQHGKTALAKQEDTENYLSSSQTLRPEELDYFASLVEFNPGWVSNNNAAMLTFTRKKREIAQKLKDLETENQHLHETIANFKNSWNWLKQL